MTFKQREPIEIQNFYSHVLNVLDLITVSDIINALDYVDHYATVSLEVCARKESLNAHAYRKTIGSCDTLDIEDNFIDLTEKRVFRKKANRHLLGHYDTVWGVCNPLGSLLRKGGPCNQADIANVFANFADILTDTGTLVLEIADTMDWTHTHDYDYSRTLGVGIRNTSFRSSQLPKAVINNLTELGVDTRNLRGIKVKCWGTQHHRGYHVHSELTLVHGDSSIQRITAREPNHMRRYGIGDILECAMVFPHVALLSIQDLGDKIAFKDGLWVSSEVPTHIVCSKSRLKGGAQPMTTS